jgi:hypothetical protein
MQMYGEQQIHNTEISCEIWRKYDGKITQVQESHEKKKEFQSQMYQLHVPPRNDRYKLSTTHLSLQDLK